MIGTLGAYRQISADLPRALARTGADPLVKSDVAYLNKTLAKVQGIDDLLKDDRLFTIAMKAFGLGDMAYAKGLMRQVLTQGAQDSAALANKLADKRFLAFAKAFDFATHGPATTRRSGFMQEIEGRFLRERLEARAGETDENVRLALYFQRMAPQVTSSYGLLADPALRKVAEVLFNLPAGTSGGSIDAQARAIEARLAIDDLKNPARMEKLLLRFTAMQGATQTSAASPNALLSSATGFDDSLLLKLQGLRLGGP